MKPENCKKLTPEGKRKRYMVEYKHEEGVESAHNQYYYEHYEQAQRKYMHFLLDQVTEKDLFRVVRFRMYNDYHDKYITVFESRVFHQCSLYDNEASHLYKKGRTPVAPRVEWRGGELE